MRILTEDLVEKAIELVKPGVESILNAEGTTWGPKRIQGWVIGPGLKRPISFMIGSLEDWKKEWGEIMNFHPIALSKLAVSAREGLPTSVIVAEKPWLLKDEEYLYPGGTTRDGITVAVSGAKGRVDEAIAEMVLSAIRMLAFLEADRRIQEKQMQI